MRRVGTLLFALSLAGALASWVRADEVDDVLRLKARGPERIRRFSAEFQVETSQPSTVGSSKTGTFRYRVTREHLLPSQRRNPRAQWRAEIEVLSPTPARLRVEGDRVWFMDPHGQWIEIPFTPEVRDRFLGMGGLDLGSSDPAASRRLFDVKVTRRNNPIFGPRTRTLTYIPKGQAKLFSWMEEDIDDDGMAVATRMFGPDGRQAVELKVKQHHKHNGVSIMEEMEAASETELGHVLSRTTCSGIQVDVEP